MADNNINFSTKHEKANVQRNTGGRKVDLPTFHRRPPITDEEVTINTHESPREKAVIGDATDNSTMSGAPKL